MAFFAWDGSSGEHGSRMAVSTWYFLALDRPTPPGVFISPVLAMLVTLTLGLVVVRRAQPGGGPPTPQKKVMVGWGPWGSKNEAHIGGMMRTHDAIAAT